MDEDLLRLLEKHRLQEAEAELAGYGVRDLARVIPTLPTEYAAIAFRLLDKDTAVAVFDDLTASSASDLLQALKEETTAELMAELDPDDRARVLNELPATVVRKLLSGLEPDERAMTEHLLGFAPDSAGRLMTPEVAAVGSTRTVAEALADLRRIGPDAETIYMVPVIGEGRVLEGVVSLRSMLVAADDALVADLMSQPVAVSASEDREVAAQLIRDHGMIGLPVVDTEDRLLGVITVDDAMRVLREEEDEDAARMGGTDPLSRPYLATSVWALVRSRIIWLLVLVMGAALTVSVLDYFAGELAQVVSLSVFIPLLIGTGGNSGAQAATTVVRAMATSEIGWRDLPRVAGKELRTGFLLGLFLASIVFLLANVVAAWDVAAVLALALIAVCCIATAVGAIVPMIAKRIGIDPAVVSAPFISTFVDTSGLIVYFLIAKAVLGI